jgi:hypothetical protein
MVFAEEGCLNMRTGFVVLMLCLMTPLSGWSVERDLAVLLVIGAGGDAAYTKSFKEQQDTWVAACQKAGVSCNVVGSQAQSDGKEDVLSLKDWLEAFVTKDQRALWIVMIGHGTYDGREAKFNLKGPDVSATELSAWLKPMTRELAVIQTASASAPFLRALTGPNRIIITATKSADEVFSTRFGSYFAKAVAGEKEADQDGDEQVSLLEAWLWSARQVKRFYEAEERLATEHSMLEDNGDGTGTRVEAFNGLIVSKSAEGATLPEGQQARRWALILNENEAKLNDAVRRRRDALEVEAQALRARKDQLPETEYYQKLEAIFLEIAKLHRS